MSIKNLFLIHHANGDMQIKHDGPTILWRPGEGESIGLKKIYTAKYLKTQLDIYIDEDPDDDKPFLVHGLYPGAPKTIWSTEAELHIAIAGIQAWAEKVTRRK